MISFLMPIAIKATLIAAVPDETAKQYFDLKNF